jgi:putative oxidoreductase
MLDRFSSYAPRALAVLRIVTGLLFLEAGVFHVFNFPASPMPTPPEMAPLMFTAGILELIGGPLILVGLLTRPVAFVLCGMMAVAYWGFHVAPMGFWPVTNYGATAILYCFVFFHLFFAGPGAWAIDNVRARAVAA